MGYGIFSDGLHASVVDASNDGEQGVESEQRGGDEIEASTLMALGTGNELEDEIVEWVKKSFVSQQ